MRGRELRPACPVCVDGMGFAARPCPGCGLTKVRTQSGQVLGLRPAAAKAYRDLQRVLEGEARPRGG